MSRTSYRPTSTGYRYKVKREEDPQKILLDTLSWREMMDYIDDQPDVYLIDVCYQSGVYIFGYRNDTRREESAKKEELNND